MGALQEILIFLVSSLFGLYILAVILRFVLALARADFYNPISQVIVTVTNPPLRLLRRIIPSIGRIDTAAVVLVLALKLIELSIISLLIGSGIALLPLLLIAIRQILTLLVWVYIVTLIVEAIMSWFGPSMAHNPLAGLLRGINRPLLAPIRRVLPPLGMIDLSPLIAILGLNILLILLRAL
ncbi:MAG: YggT family protein [Ectothiorhodospiraceae bacterium]|jgi:YggT family protein|nr:YggT family protein [Ectothiorhodospiraceae bacterium]